MKFEIKSRWTGALLFSIETDSRRLALQAAVKQGAYLQGADLQGADLRGADLQGADLRGAYLQGADLRGADLRGADLRGADLRGADLRGAYLRGADLQGADLQGAYLRGAYLQGAYLRGADLQGAYLQGAYLQGAYLQGAKGVTPKVLQILGSRDAVIVHAYGKVDIGCMSESLEWWEANYQTAGEKKGYSADEIAEYAEHVAAARKFMERYQLLTEPKPETAHEKA